MKILLPLLLLIPAEAWSFEIDGVPFVRQESRWCGPASLASVLSYYGAVIDQGTIAREVHTEKLGGALITDLENYARSQGFETRLGQGTQGDIEAALKERRPVIALVDLGFWVVSRPHYLVITGFDETGFRVHTGYEAGKLIPYEEFHRIWNRKGSVYLLVWR